MSSTVKEIKEKTGYLKRSDLYTIGVGQAIGSGVLTLIGPAILLTGQSAWLAYVAACIWGFMMIAPIPWITSTLKLGGGFYSLVGDMAGKRVARYVCSRIFATDDQSGDLWCGNWYVCKFPVAAD